MRGDARAARWNMWVLRHPRLRAAGLPSLVQVWPEGFPRPWHALSFSFTGKRQRLLRIHPAPATAWPVKRVLSVEEARWVASVARGSSQAAP